MAAVNNGRGNQQPEALSEFAKSARRKDNDEHNKSLAADSESKPIPTENELKHDVAEKLLHAGAKGKKLDPDRAGADQLPDRVIDNKK